MAELPQEVAESVAVLNRYLVGQTSLEELLQRVAELTQTAVSADMAGVTLVQDGRPRTAVFTDPATKDVDAIQYETGVGPCLDAYRLQQVFRIDSTGDESRWPAFTGPATEQGVHSTLSLPLVVEDEGIGGLNLYAHRRSAFDQEDEAVGRLIADHAAVAIANAQAYWGAYELSQQLNEALASRATIEQAKGVLMAAEGCGPDEAFAILRRASQNRNQKLRDIAKEIVERTQQRKKG